MRILPRLGVFEGSSKYANTGGAAPENMYELNGLGSLKPAKRQEPEGESESPGLPTAHVPDGGRSKRRSGASEKM
jgi:hypothetical protein